VKIGIHVYVPGVWVKRQSGLVYLCRVVYTAIKAARDKNTWRAGLGVQVWARKRALLISCGIPTRIKAKSVT
jgi:nitrous oxidase accessory protein NosD